MTISEAKSKIKIVKAKLHEMQNIASYVTSKSFEHDENGFAQLNRASDMETEDPDGSLNLHTCWEDAQKNVPPGFSIEGNLVRHLFFNQAGDWYDIAHSDIPLELKNIEEYEEKIILVEYLDTLHPEVSRVSEIVLSGDIDGALKIIYATLESKIRSFLKSKPNESTVPEIGRAFREGVFIAHQPENSDAIRNLLQGVIGYYRHNILHKQLPNSRNNISSSLSLFAVAHESFILLDRASRHLNR